MRPLRMQGWGSSLALSAVLLSISVAMAQQPDTDQGEFAAATLPQSNEALLYSSRIEEAIQAGDYRLAVELIERLMDLPPGLVALPASRTYHPVWRQAFRLQAQLPEAGVALYRQLHDAEVEARFGQAAACADVETLRELFHRYRLSTAWPAIGTELTAHLLDQGAYGEAIEVLREMAPPGERSDAGEAAVGVPEQAAQMVVALAGSGALRPARRLFADLRSKIDIQAQPAWRERLEQMERWLTGLAGEGAGLVAEGPAAFTPCIEAGAVWHQALAPEGRQVGDGAGEDLADAVDALRRLPVQQPVLAGDVMVVRLLGRVYAFETETLLPRWRATERLSHEAGDAVGVVSGEQRADDLRLSPDAESLLTRYLDHAVSVGFGNVYAIERLESSAGDFGLFGQRPFQAVREVSGRSELVARDLESGHVVWRTAAEATSPLYDVKFQNVPLVIGESVAAPIQRGDEVSLAVINPTDGALIREVPLVGPPTYLPSAGGRCLMVADATTLYVCTGNGVIAALARGDLSWKWATVYPSTLAQHLMQWWWQPAEVSVEPNIDLPVIADDLLVVAPVDSAEMFALDRFDGRERWRISRREHPYLIGALSGGVVVGGREIACLELSDPVGREPRWRSVPLRITGRAAVHDERVFVPTREGVVVLDGRNGKVLADQTAVARRPTDRDDRPGAGSGAHLLAGVPAGRGGTPECTANLLASEDALFSVSTSRVVKYPDLRRAQARYAGEADGGVGGEADALVRAWLDALAGRHEEAFARLRACSFDESRLAAARDQLLTYVFLGLAADASAGEDRLSWLQRASELADSPDSAADLAVAVGQALEGSGQWAAALRHYGQLLRQPEVGHVVDREDPSRRVAGWLHAAERIGQTRALAPTALMAELVDQALSSGERRTVNLQRLWVALEDEPEGDRIGQLLCMQKLAPELKMAYLPRESQITVPPELRRRLHLERWDTHVSLGRLEEARADQIVWEEQFARTTAPDVVQAQLDGIEPLSADAERDRVNAIDLAFRKLVQSEGEPFTSRVARQWKIERAELLVDPRCPLGESRPWILIANLEQHRIELINVFKHQYPQRQTEDGMLAARDGTAAGEAYGRAIEGQRFEWAGGRRAAWPAVLHQQLAAIPVRGGLVCVGLGPERYAGRRQWEYAVPEWNTVPADFTDRSAAGWQGVFFTPRPGRVVLVGWFDGALWWQRDLPGATVERLYLSGDQLVIVGDDQRIWVTDATFGRRLQRAETGLVAPQRVDVVDDTIVVWGSESAVGISSATRKQVWRQPCPAVADTAVVQATCRSPSDQPLGWIAFRAYGQSEWWLLDARRGRPVFERSLGEFGAISAAVADPEHLLVAGPAGPGAEGEQNLIRLSAFDSTSGERLWSRDLPAAVEVNIAQLAAHPDLIPILIAGEGGASGAGELPAIRLVSKRDGEVGEPLSINADYRAAAEATCEMYMLVTPTRMIVQAGGNLIAYGNSPLQSGP